ERGSPRPYRRPVVAVFPDGPHRGGTFSREPSSHLAGPQRRAGGRRTWVAGERPLVVEILERSGEGEKGAWGCFLLLERGTAARSERAAVARHGGDSAGVSRSRFRILDDSYRHGPTVARENSRYLLARRGRGLGDPRWSRRREARGVDRRAPE